MILIPNLLKVADMWNASAISWNGENWDMSEEKVLREETSAENLPLCSAVYDGDINLLKSSGCLNNLLHFDFCSVIMKNYKFNQYFFADKKKISAYVGDNIVFMIYSQRFLALIPGKSTFADPLYYVISEKHFTKSDLCVL